ncbi:MAG: HD domain-containing protein [Chitinophagaceae bacterium]
MASSSRKIINDPVYGFITIDHPLLLQVIAHPYYQRLRRVHQMAFASLVYPGAVHSRLHHSLGAYHLMCCALTELQSKGVAITPDEALAAKIAILLHDIGHGPFSHALEYQLLANVHHEDLSLLIMHHMNAEMDGKLETAIKIFTDTYHKPFLHQLISGQLDVDRMDYLTRDSFFSGVSEGAIGYDRILKMLTVAQSELMVEEKGIYTIEKFLVSRRLMYWQVYLHKTVVSAEKTVVRIMERAKELIGKGADLHASTPAFDYFLQHPEASNAISEHLDKFCMMDDYDVLSTIKNWMFYPDTILSLLCRSLVDRRLLKVKFEQEPFDEAYVQSLRNNICTTLGVSEAAARYLVFTGEASNTTYDPTEEHINILFKDGSIKDISKVDNALIQHNLSRPMKKFYICYYSLQP